MATKTLVIDSDNRDHFFLAVDAGTLAVGDSPTRPEGAVRLLRVVRVRCEIEIEEDRDSVAIEQTGVIAPLVLRHGAPVLVVISQNGAELPNG